MTPQEAIEIRKNPTWEDIGNEELTKCIDESLEKRVPRKPILDTIFSSGVVWYLCPACRHNNIEKSDFYCHNCGQAIDWSDTE